MSLSTSPILAAAASNDLHTVRWLVERESVPVDCSADWLVPDSSGVNKSGEQRGLDAGRKQLERTRRTPLMVAASTGPRPAYPPAPARIPTRGRRFRAMPQAPRRIPIHESEAIRLLLLFGGQDRG